MCKCFILFFFFFSSRRRHTRSDRDWSSDVCSSDLLGDGNLAAQRLPWRLDAAVDFMAELHLRAARHPLVPEVRWRARDHGVHFFTSNVRDAVAALEGLATPPRDVPPAFGGARERLLQCLYALRDDAPRRVRLMEEAGRPDPPAHRRL